MSARSTFLSFPQWLASVAAGLLALMLVASCAMPGASTSTADDEALRDFPRTGPDGGANFYQGFPAAATAGWTRPDFFPIGVWLESVQTPEDINQDKRAGINTYFHLTSNSNTSLLSGTGMSVIAPPQAGSASGLVAGWFLTDEMDMRAGPGDAPWLGDPDNPGQQCVSAEQQCGYTAMSSIIRSVPQGDGHFRWANYGKGVMLWQTDQQAERFVNNYTDVISADVYWYTDPTACISATGTLGLPEDQCRRAINYGRMIDRLRGFQDAGRPQQPIMAFVELGRQASEAPGIHPDQVQGAVISSIIHGARGVIYFGHSFAGDCVSAHLLRDPCAAATRQAVSTTNAQLRDLAPALNSPDIRVDLGPDIDGTLKQLGSDYYVIAMRSSGGDDRPVRAMTLPDALRGANITAPYEENRVVGRGTDGQVLDTFPSESSYHIYKLSPGAP